jgi:hypothetical protein
MAREPSQTEPSSDPAVDEYVAALNERQRGIAAAFRKLVARIAPDVVESVAWGLPTYTGRSRLCYLRGTPTHLQVGFWRGAELPDPESMLRGTGDRVRHVRLRHANEVETKPFRALLRAALKLDAKT